MEICGREDNFVSDNLNATALKEAHNVHTLLCNPSWAGDVSCVVHTILREGIVEGGGGDGMNAYHMIAFHSAPSLRL